LILEKTALKKLPRLIVSDIGGTLSYTDTIPNNTVEVLNKIIKTGTPIILITGFNFHTTKKYVKGLDKEIILMPQNGTLCLNSDKILWEYSLNKDITKKIHDYLNENYVHIIVYKGISEIFYILYKGKDIFEKRNTFTEVKRFNDFNNISGISTIVSFKSFKIISDKIGKIIGNNYQMILVKEENKYWVEITPKEVRKDLAIKRFCKENNISLSDVIFFGDNYNDLELLRTVGTPVVMNNAVEDIKKEFNIIADSVYNEGVAKFLSEIYLN
jgi:Cof subfamily protein (haloacid dehalogenase superfamily)